MGAELFFECKDLVSVYNFPSNFNIDGGPDYYGYYEPNIMPTAIFDECINLETLELKEELIGIDGLVNCKKLNPTFPSTITYVGMINGCGIKNLDLSNCWYFGAAAYCEDLLNVVLGENLTTIGGFRNCTKLQTISGFPTSITEIPDYWAQNCTGLERVDLTESVNRIGQYAFENCTSLTSVGVANVKTLGRSSFYNCESLGFININSQLISIPNYCFYNCRSVQGITLSKDLYYIGTYAFMDCISLDLVINANQEDVDIRLGAFDNTKSVTWI